MTRKFWYLIIVVMTLWPLGKAAVGGRIVLKDGTVEQSDKIWESDNYYHFILKGTKDVEIRYSKAIVDHVEHFSTERYENRTISRPKEMDLAGKRKPADQNQIPQDDVSQGACLAAKPVHLPDERIINENKGIAFYDPRRSDRYWVTRQSRYSTLKNALDAISALYSRSPAWVESYMGEANDLGAIHQNLMSQLRKEISERPKKSSQAPAGEPNILNPASSQREQRPAALGPLNDTSYAGEYPQAETGRKILFYDPRRAEKYWTGLKSRYNTFHEAVSALANQYHVSDEWISDHMGASNDLTQIHRNIKKSIVPSTPPSD